MDTDDNVEITATGITVKSGTYKVESTINCSITVSDGAKLIIAKDAAVKGTITNDGVVELYTDTTNETTINGGVVAVAPGIVDGSAGTDKTIVSTTSLEDAFGMSQDLESDYTVKTKAFLENNLNEDGSVNVPVALRPYMGGKEKLVPVK